MLALLRATIDQTHSSEFIALGPEDIVECDEVYPTAGLKGLAGGLSLERDARKFGEKKSNFSKTQVKLAQNFQKSSTSGQKEEGMI